MRVTPFFRWYDLWIGAYVDVDKRTLYVCPLPMLGLKIELAPRPIVVGCIASWIETDEIVQVTKIEGTRSWIKGYGPCANETDGWVPTRELRRVA